MSKPTASRLSDEESSRPSVSSTPIGTPVYRLKKSALTAAVRVSPSAAAMPARVESFSRLCRVVPRLTAAIRAPFAGDAVTVNAVCTISPGARFS